MLKKITPHSSCSIRNSLSILTPPRWSVVLTAHSISLKWILMVETTLILIKVIAPKMVLDTAMVNVQLLNHILKMVNTDHVALKWISGRPIKLQHNLPHILVQVKEISSAKVICVADQIDTMVSVIWMVADMLHIRLINMSSTALDLNLRLTVPKSLQ